MAGELGPDMSTRSTRSTAGGREERPGAAELGRPPEVPGRNRSRSGAAGRAVKPEPTRTGAWRLGQGGLRAREDSEPGPLTRSSQAGPPAGTTGKGGQGSAGVVSPLPVRRVQGRQEGPLEVGRSGRGQRNSNDLQKCRAGTGAGAERLGGRWAPNQLGRACGGWARATSGHGRTRSRGRRLGAVVDGGGALRLGPRRPQGTG